MPAIKRNTLRTTNSPSNRHPESEITPEIKNTSQFNLRRGTETIQGHKNSQLSQATSLHTRKSNTEDLTPEEEEAVTMKKKLSRKSIAKTGRKLFNMIPQN